jgi:hypothetical protein
MKDGYYWVKYDGTWYVGKHETRKFIYLNGESLESLWNFPTDTLLAGDFDEIGDYIETPDKYKE